MLIRDLDEQVVDDRDLSMIIRKASLSDAETVFNALSAELVSHLPRNFAWKMVEGRQFSLRGGMPCFREDELVGGCWCPGSRNARYLEQTHILERNTAKITTLFITLAWRGRGISSQLCRRVCKYLAQEGFDYCLSMVWYLRPASILAHLRAGFKPVGEKTTWSVLGFRSSGFHHNYNIARLEEVLAG